MLESHIRRYVITKYNLLVKLGLVFKIKNFFLRTCLTMPRWRAWFDPVDPDGGADIFFSHTAKLPT